MRGCELGKVEMGRVQQRCWAGGRGGVCNSGGGEGGWGAGAERKRRGKGGGEGLRAARRARLLNSDQEEKKEAEERGRGGKRCAQTARIYTFAARTSDAAEPLAAPLVLRLRRNLRHNLVTPCEL